MRTNRLRCALYPALLLALLSPGLALAVDGVREINQTCAVQTGCFPGDSAGFPVTISAAGSYRLTSNLTFSATLGPPSSDFIEISADRVTLDLNGFELRCTFPLTGNPCSRGTFAGIDVTGSGIRIENGFVSGMPGRGITASGFDVVVERVQVIDNGGTGILLGGRNGVVRNCLSASNDLAGIFNGSATPSEGTLTEGNVVRDNGDDGITGSGMVRNNVVVGNGNVGISTGQAVVEGNTVRANDGDGIFVVGATLVLDNVVVGNGGYGVQGFSSFSYRGNMILGNTQGTVIVSSGTALDTGGNACNGSLVCP